MFTDHIKNLQETQELIAYVPMDCNGMRFDKVLAQLFSAYSRTRLQQWIDQGCVSVEGLIAGPKQHVYGGEKIILTPLPLPEELAFTAEPIDLEVVYEDDQLLVINKAAGLVVHPAAGNWSGTVLNGLLSKYGHAAACLPRAGIVHRLDKDTSGLMVVARTLTAHTDLVRQLQARSVKRHYLAVVFGKPPSRDRIETFIGRDLKERTRMAVVDSEAYGKIASTRFITLSTIVWNDHPVSLILCALDTGRTHQIRVHMAHRGYPLIGDPVYKGKLSHVLTQLPMKFSRQALHAYRLALMHPAPPTQHQLLSWQAELPSDMQALLEAFGMRLPDTMPDFD